MSFGEDRNKVKNIVTPQIGKFRELYSSLWPGLAAYAEFNTSSGRCEQDTSPGARMFHLNLLPKQIQVITYATFAHNRLRESLPDKTPRTGSHESSVQACSQ
jgi:hypothetical protein